MTEQFLSTYIVSKYMAVKDTLESICDVAEEMLSMLPDDPKPDDMTEDVYERLRAKGDELQRHRDALEV